MDQQQFEAMLRDVELRLRRLKMLYDQWFAGVERVEPAVARKEVDDLLARLRREQVRNTALRFRLQQVIQRHTTFTTYWRRIARQIEEGTYHRDVLKARKLRDQLATGKKSGPVEDSFDADVDIDVELDWSEELAGALAGAEQAAHAATAPKTEPSAARDPAPHASGPAVVVEPVSPEPKGPQAQAPSGALEQAKPGERPSPPPQAALGPRTISPFALPLPAAGKGAVPPPPPDRARAAASGGTAKAGGRSPAHNPTPPAGAASQLSPEDVQRIYANYLAARKKNAERTDNVKLDTIERTLRTMLPRLEKKHAGKKIDFEIVVKDGRVALKPVAK